MNASVHFDTGLVLDKKKVRASFSAAAETYDKLAVLQRKVGLDLLAQANRQDAVDIVVDIGCGTGFLTHELLLKVFARQMIAVDIALPMVQTTRAKLKQYSTVQYLCGDVEYLPMSKHSVDRIYSNLALQWCQDLTSVFYNFNQVLKQNGQVFFSTFGPTTLQELKQSWAEVDSFTHVNDFYSDSELFVSLKKAGFHNIQIESKRYQLNYQTVLELMRELKGIGANNALSGRNRKTTTKTRMQKMIESYEKYRVNGLIPATYEIYFVSANTAL